MDCNKSFGIFILRLSLSLPMLLAHGYGKLLKYDQLTQHFPDPLGLGSYLSANLIIFAEFFCALLIALGIFTRLFSIPLVIAMAVAFFIFHGTDPFGKKELSYLYMMGFIALSFCGGGCYQLGKFIPVKTNHKLLKFFLEKE